MWNFRRYRFESCPDYRKKKEMRSSLKEQSEALSGLSFYDPRYASFLLQEKKLFEKVSKLIIREAQKQGGVAQSSYIYSMYSKIWNGTMTFNQLRKHIVG